jgi:hypothetical protein
MWFQSKYFLNFSQEEFENHTSFELQFFIDSWTTQKKKEQEEKKRQINNGKR